MSKVRNNIISLCEIVEMGLLRNKDNRSTNPILSVYTKLDVRDNTTFNTIYTVKCFDDPNIYGFIRKEFAFYQEAKEFYDNHLETYHVK